MSDERRMFQRLTFSPPLDGWFGDHAVRLLNVSATGALFRSDEPLPDGARAFLRFVWRGQDVELLAEVSRIGDDGTGVAFVDDAGMVRNLIADSATELLRAQEANAMGIRDKNIFGDQTLTAASSRVSSTFITWTLGPNGWKSRTSLLPDQPENGFTIYAAEPADQVAMLCRTYESGDEESRRLTRMLAELSVASQPLSGG